MTLPLTPRHGCLGLAAVLLITFAVYAPSLSNGYAADDRRVAMGVDDQGERNPMVWDLRPLADYVRAPAGRGGDPADRHYRPVTVWSHALVHQLGRPSEPDFGDREQRRTAFPQHLANVLGHLLAVVMVYALVRQLRGGVAPSLLAALVFGLHAVHSETVAAIAGRAQILAFVFGALGTWLLFAVERRGAVARIPAMPLAAACFFLAFGSEEAALGWVGFLAAYGLAFRWRTRDEAAWLRGAAVAFARHLIVAAVPLAAYGLLRAGATGEFAPEPVAYAANPLFAAPLGERVLTAIGVWGWKGLGLTLAPFRLAGDYGAEVLPRIASAADPRFLAAAAALSFVLVAALRAARRQPLAFLGACTFFGFGLLVSNLPFAIDSIFAERLYYAPSAGLAFFAAWLVERIDGRPAARLVLGVATAGWLGASALVILQRNPVWENDATFYLHEARNQPRSARMQHGAAGVHAGRAPKERAAALRHLWKAVRIDPDYALAWNDLAAIYRESGDLGLAEQCAVTGLQARRAGGREVEGRLEWNRALILEAMGRREEAFAALKRALLRGPRLERVWTEILRRTKEDEARKIPGAFDRLAAVIDEGARAEPAAAAWPYLRGLLCFELNRSEEAVAEFRQALALDRWHVAARRELVRILQARAGADPDEILRLARAGDEVDPFQPQWPFARAVVHGRAGRRSAAAAELVEALGRSPEFGPAWAALRELAAAEDGFAAARAALAAQAAKRPDSPVWPYFDGVLLGRSGRLPEGMDRMGDALAIQPSYTPAWRELVAMSEGGGGPARVLEVVRRAGDGSTRSAREWPYYEGMALCAAGEARAAAIRFAEAVRRDPTYLEARCERLAVTHDTDPPATVREVLRGGFATHPEDPHWPLYRGLLLHREGRLLEALPVLRQALDGLPGHPLARFTLGACLAELGDTAAAVEVFRALAADARAAPALREKARAARDRLAR